MLKLNKGAPAYRSPAQRVAEACGANPVAVIVPCHRVVRSDGSIGGYRWGTGRKKALLAGELPSTRERPHSERELVSKS